MASEKVICDTDVLIDYWDTQSKRHFATKEILEKKKKIELDNVVISAITKMELMQGTANKAEEIKISKRLARFNTALINNEITIEALLLFETYRLSHGLAIPDCLIAATSKITALDLFTFNQVDFKFIRQLKLYPLK